MRRLGLRARVTAGFAGGGLALSATLAVSTYELTRQHLLDERERTAVRATVSDATVVRQGLSAAGADVVTVLRSLDTGTGRQPLLRRDGRWFARTADDGLTAAVPVALLREVERGHVSVQRVAVAGSPVVVVGVPLPRVEADLYEVQSLAETRGTLRSLAGTLVGVAAVVTLVAAGLGRAAAGRLLRPLRAVSDAARRVSDGDLTTRMDPSPDPDLAPLTESFNTMVGEVTTRVQREQRFAADVSHELRSPLQTLTAASSVLRNRAAHLDPRSAAAAGLVAEEADRFSALVLDLLELARDEVPAELRLHDVRGAVLAALARKRLDPDLADVAAGLGAWPLDRRRADRLLDNLLDNADRHGGGLVRFGALERDGWLRLEVDDAGPGVPASERSLVFDRFGRGRAAHARGGSDGTGLGLSLVRRHAGSHGGAVTVEDRPGGGARFVVLLPRAVSGGPGDVMGAHDGDHPLPVGGAVGGAVDGGAGDAPGDVPGATRVPGA